jgi:hypothetical protein
MLKKALEEKLANLFDNIQVAGLDVELDFSKQDNLIKVSLKTSNPIEKGSKYQFFRDFIRLKLYVFDRDTYQIAKNNFWANKRALERDNRVKTRSFNSIYLNLGSYNVKETSDTLDMSLGIAFRQLKDVYFGILVYVDYKALENYEGGGVELQKDYEDFGSKLVLLQVYDEFGFNPVSLAHYVPDLISPAIGEIYQGPYVGLNATSKFRLNALAQDKEGFYADYSQSFINGSDAVVGTQIYKGLIPERPSDIFTFLKTLDISLSESTTLTDNTPIVEVLPKTKGQYNVDIYDNMALLTVNKDYMRDTTSVDVQEPIIKSLTIDGKSYSNPLVVDNGDNYTVIVPVVSYKLKTRVKLEYTLSSKINSKPLIGSSLSLPLVSGVTEQNILRNIEFEVSTRLFSIEQVGFSLNQVDIDNIYNAKVRPNSFFTDVLKKKATQLVLEKKERSTPLDFPKSDQLVLGTLLGGFEDIVLETQVEPARTYQVQEISRLDIAGTTISETWVTSILGVIPEKLQRVLINDIEQFRFIGK